MTANCPAAAPLRAVLLPERGTTAGVVRVVEDGEEDRGERSSGLFYQLTTGN